MFFDNLMYFFNFYIENVRVLPDISYNHKYI